MGSSIKNKDESVRVLVLILLTDAAYFIYSIL